MNIVTDQKWWTRIPVNKPGLQVYGSQTPANSSSVGDSFEISDLAQSRIDGLKSAENSLKEALKQGRSNIRSDAAGRIKAARDYLLMLAAMSSPGDRHAAKEAARVAQEIKDSVREYGNSLTRDQGGEQDAAPTLKMDELKALAQFSAEAMGAIELARMIITRYLRSKKPGAPGDEHLALDLDGASEAVKKLASQNNLPF